MPSISYSYIISESATVQYKDVSVLAHTANTRHMHCYMRITSDRDSTQLKCVRQSWQSNVKIDEMQIKASTWS